MYKINQFLINVLSSLTNNTLEKGAQSLFFFSVSVKKDCCKWWSRFLCVCVGVCVWCVCVWRVLGVCGCWWTVVGLSLPWWAAVKNSAPPPHTTHPSRPASMAFVFPFSVFLVLSLFLYLSLSPSLPLPLPPSPSVSLSLSLFSSLFGYCHSATATTLGP